MTHGIICVVSNMILQYIRVHGFAWSDIGKLYDRKSETCMVENLVAINMTLIFPFVIGN